MDGIGINPNIEYDIVKETPAEGPYEPISTLVQPYHERTVTPTG